MRAWLPLLAVLLAGCPPPQSGACKKYVDCQAAYDKAAGHQAKPTIAYEPNGPCWSDGQIAAQCTQECLEMNRALEAAVTANKLDVPSCR